MTTVIITRVFQTYLAQPRWVGWHLVDDNKIPLVGTSQRKAHIDKPDTWRPFAECPDDRRGIIFNGDGLGGIDLDGCRYPDGKLTEWAEDWIRRFNSYTEVSPSGAGVKIFVRGCPKLAHHLLTMAGEPINGKASQIEAYVDKRYFTITGDHLAETPQQINEAAEAWAELIAALSEQASSGSSTKRQGRNGALYSLYCSLRKKGCSAAEAAATVRAENRQGNTARHPKFAEGALPEREVDGIIRNAERRQDDDDDRPTIEVRAGQLHLQASEAEDALVATKTIYAQSGRLVRAMVKEADATRGRTTLITRIVPCDLDWMLRQLSQTVRCVRWHEATKNRKDGFSTIDVPSQLAKSILASASDEFNELAGIIETPTMRPDGSLLFEPGYDPVTGLLLVNPPPMPAIPDKPSQGEAKAALTLLNELLDEFPFVDDASRSVALSMLITPVVRGAMDFAPAHTTTAPEPGSGKSYVADIMAAIATGQPCPVLSAGVDEEELEKRLNGEVLEGAPFISLDNVNGVLKSAFLCQMVTQRELKVRTLGVTGQRSVKNRTTVFANGNNIEIFGDLVRRSIQCKLDPQMEDPTTRAFKGNPVATVLVNRGIFIAAALTVVRAHMAAGYPGRTPSLAGFEQWSRLVRSALVWLGRADPAATQEDLRVADPAVAALDLVMQAWAEGIRDEKIEDVPLTVSQLLNNYHLDRQLREVTYTRSKDDLSAVKVGNFFKRHRGRVRKGAKLVSEFDKHRKQQTWRLVGWQSLVDETVVSFGERKGSGRAKKTTRKPPPGNPPMF